MDCREAREIIRRERDELANEDELERLRSHLLACKNCRSFRKAALGAMVEEEEEEVPRRSSRRMRAEPRSNTKLIVVAIAGTVLLTVVAAVLLGGGGEDGETPSLVPDALSACSTAEGARQLASLLALDALDEALSVRIGVRRLIGAEFGRAMALRARTGKDVGDIRLLLGVAYGTFDDGPGGDSPEPNEGVRRALLLVRSRAHGEAAEALQRAGVGGALAAHERLMTGDFSASAAGIAGEAIASHAAEPPQAESRGKHARLLARACRFDEALDALGDLTGPRGKYSLTRGISLREKGGWREAVEELMKLKDSPSTARQTAGFLLAGMTLLERGKYSEGMRTLDRGKELAAKTRGPAGAVMSYGLAWLYLHDYGSGRVGKIHADGLGGSPHLESRARPGLARWSDEMIALRRKSPERKSPPRTQFTDAMGYSPEDSDVSYALRRLRFDSRPAGLSGGGIETSPGRGGVLKVGRGGASFDSPFVETVTTVACSVRASGEGVFEISAETDRGERYVLLVPGLPAGEWVDLDAPLGAFEGPGSPFGKRFARVGFSHPGGAVVDDVIIFHGPDFER